MYMKSIDKAQAILEGLALGDALGYPTEFLSLRDIASCWKPNGIQEPPNPALFTDDTQMTIAVTRALVLQEVFKLPVSD